LGARAPTTAIGSFSELPRAIPQPLQPGAGKEDRLRYVRHWAVLAALVAIPCWAAALAYTSASWVRLVLGVVVVVTALNIATLSWRIHRDGRS
jgi:hypothetical protein